MDGSQKRVAIIPEVTRGTTPADPAFLVLRNIRATGGKQQARTRSPERLYTRASNSSYAGLVTIPYQIEAPLTYDVANHSLFASAFQGAWATDVLKTSSTIAGMTLEEKYEGGATDFYRRCLGFFVESMSLVCRNGEPGMLTFGGRGLTESTGSAILTNATYVDPSPNGTPMTPASFVLNDVFSLTTPKVQGFTMNLRNNAYDLHGFGSDDPYDQGLGQLDIDGTVDLYFRTAAEYTGFVGAGMLGGVIDLTMGSVTTNKYRLKLPNCDIWAPALADPGPSGPIVLTVNYMGHWKASDNAAAILTRAMA